MKKILSLMALTVCSSAIMAQEPPSQEKMDAVHTCMNKAGIEMPAHGQGKPPQLSDEQKKIVDNCFKENGVEPPKGPRHPQ